jgi:putative ABC transport system ATP-binding protein
MASSPRKRAYKEFQKIPGFPPRGKDVSIEKKFVKCLNLSNLSNLWLRNPMVENPIVQLKNVTKSYRRGNQVVPVLEDITFEIAKGDFVALMGPSGSGKSTLLNLIAGLDKVDGGSISVGGVEITALSETELADWRAASVGFIFQFYNLIPVLTAFENVELPLLLTGLARRERREHAELALKAVNLEDRMDHYPSQLSGGQQQRVAIARAVVTDPAILVADEPTGDLDKVSAYEILDLMERLNAEAGKTIIMVTHDPRAAEKAHTLRRLEKGVLTDAS